MMRVGLRLSVGLVIAVTCAAVSIAAAGGCGSFTGSDSPAPPGIDAGGGGGGGFDGAIVVVGEGGVVTQYLPMSDKNSWETVDLGSFVANAGGYRGGTFDGRYMYLAPDTGTNFLRFDTQGTFSSSGSWTNAALGMQNLEYFGMAYDGRFVYAAPFEDGNGNGLGILLRYDTMAPWKPASWESFALGAGRFIGMGRGPGHMFLSPRGGTAIAVLNAGQSPEGGVTLVDAGSPTPQFRGGAYAGGHYYFAPFQAPDGTSASGVILRYAESAGTFDPMTAASFDYAKAATDNAARGFSGAVTDGQYVYFVPYYTNADNYLSTVLRYDTTLPFGTASSYQTFDIRKALGQARARGFIGSAFDGRFIYFVPDMDDTDTNTFAVRYDTAGNFTTASSWQIYDLTNVDLHAGGYWGAVFDGEYVYFVPNSNNVMLRFHARTPRALPAPYPAAP